ncbi:hypothetical protein SAMN05216470_2053 [Streptococcus equinus]|uniref:Uncharacterized protein n=1 Tax=Streptococcus equinus TaxID=1335 RepID=A0A239RG49_STREI|nr:hypothetical protein [Streptococcus equinus]SNU09842.1 hypothetical protein SAMN05216470_2053 [Streptococcus equinus]
MTMVKMYRFYDLETKKQFEGTNAEAANYFEVCRSTFDARVKNGRIKREPIGRKDNGISNYNEKTSSQAYKRVLRKQLLIASFG